MSPRFTVITPMLNGSQDISGYVYTLQSQTYPNWEAVVVDDGSQDGSIELILRLTRHDQRFTITSNPLTKEAQGPYQARNYGLTLAKGEFICFLDIDDRWMPWKLKHYSNIIETNPQIRLVYSAYYRAKRDSGEGRVRLPNQFLSPKALIHISNPVPMLTACMHRSSLADIRFCPISHEDFVFWHSVFKKLLIHQIYCCAQASAIYCVHNNSISSNKLTSIVWIWKCYRTFGYSIPIAAIALIIRACLHLATFASEVSTPMMPLRF
jgi:teichuronic acid biosynthesis glycosyltransferase TuaG